MSSEDVAEDMSQQIAESQPVVQEKMVPQSKVNEIVAAKLARERAEYEAQGRSMGGMHQPAAIDEEALLAKAVAKMQEQQEAQRMAQQEEFDRQQVQKVAEDYLEKMKQGKELYEDFDEVTKSYNPSKYPQVTIMAAQMDNLPDIIYELKKNPQKLTHLHVLALTDPDEAQAELGRLSASIKRNDEALASKVKSPTPLSRLKPSTAAGQDTGKRSIRDLRKDPKYRG